MEIANGQSTVKLNRKRHFDVLRDNLSIDFAPNFVLILSF